MKKVLYNILHIFIIVTIVASTVTLFSFVFADNSDNDNRTRFNIMFVIDGSQSMIGDANGEGATDPNGYRYNATELFLEILETDGHNVGAIVFSDGDFLLDKPITQLNSREDKNSLINEVRAVGTKYATDTGRALESAVSQLINKKKENGLKSIVFLLTDGQTYLEDCCSEEKGFDVCGNCYNTKTPTDCSVSLSYETAERAFEEDIHILGALLNDGGAIESLELFDIIRKSRNIDTDPETIDRNWKDGPIKGLGNQYIEIHRSSDLIRMADQFSGWLYFRKCENVNCRGCTVCETIETTDDFGYFYNDISIPTVGVAELNINVMFGIEPNYIMLTSPNNEEFRYNHTQKDSLDSSLNNLDVFTTHRSWNIKLTSDNILIPGLWKVEYHSEPRIDFMYSILLQDNGVTANTEAVIRDSEIMYKSWLSYRGEPIPIVDYEVYNTPLLQFWDEETGSVSEHEMKLSDNGSYYYKLLPVEIGETYHAVTKYYYGYKQRQVLESDVIKTQVFGGGDEPETSPHPDVFIGSEQQRDTVVFYMKNGLDYIGYNLYISDKESDLKTVLEKNIDLPNVVVYKNIEFSETDDGLENKYSIQASEIEKNFKNLYRSEIYFSIRAIDTEQNEIQTYFTDYIRITQMFIPREVAVLLVITGCSLMLIALILSFKKCVHEIAVENESIKHLLRSDCKYVIFGKGSDVHSLKKAPDVFNEKPIAEIVPSPVYLPFPLLKTGLMARAIKGSVIKVNSKELKEGSNTVTVERSGERHNIPIWYTGLFNRNAVKGRTIAFWILIILGAVSTTVGALFL